MNRPDLIRLASSLPKGSVERRAVLARLASTPKTAAYYQRWNAALDKLRAAAAAANGVGRYPRRAEDDPSIEMFEGTESLDVQSMLEDIWNSLINHDGSSPIQF